MAKLKFIGMDVYVGQLTQLEQQATGRIKLAVYDGAKVIADEVRSSLEANIQHKDKSTGDLLNSMYLAKMTDESGYIYTEIGFAGYDSKGVANSIKARAMESGTSRQKKRPFIRKAFSAKKEACISAMADRVDKEIQKIMEA